jgi:hypothetical protein
VTTDGLRCEGQERVGCWCGKEGRIDCTKQFGHKKCDDNAYYTDICVPAGGECDAAGAKDTCEGTTLVFCDDGMKAKLDCLTLGFKGCGPLKAGGQEIGAVCQ